MEIGSIIEIHPEELFCEYESAEISFPFMKGHHWYTDFFNTGRAAIQAYIEGLSAQKIWVPSFICSSVTDAIIRAGKEIVYYPVTRQLQIDLNFFKDKSVKKGDCFYLMQYFTVSISKECLKFLTDLREQGTVIFEDITMSLFSEAGESFAIGDYIIGSIRKWCAIPDGAFIASRYEKNMMSVDKASAGYDYTLYYFAAQTMKSYYLNDVRHHDKNKFLSYSRKGIEYLFGDYTIREMSEISYDLLHRNWDRYCSSRVENYEYLYHMIKNIRGISLLDNFNGMIPLGMFILTEERDRLFNYLIEKDIYCNVHWKSNKSTEMFADSAWLSNHCITIPCDQRYGKQEMKYIYETIKAF